MSKHINIALFVPHAGCPNLCSFCNQKVISGQTEPLTHEDVEQSIKTALAHSDCSKAQLAFFGGSFTAIDSGYRLSLLKAAKPFIDDGFVESIRISTRPDAITEEILDELKFYGVKSIELGAQSMDDRVLMMNSRGHTSDEVRNASRLIKQYGFELGLQMMTGLYGDSDKGALYTADEIIKLNPDTVRVYPTVVLKGTRLAELYEQGVFHPQTVEDAVELGSLLLEKFREKNIPVIRFGLHASGDVERDYVAGAYHPALRELCESRIYLRKAKELLKDKSKSNKYILEVSNKEISKMTGQHKCNLDELKKLGYSCRVHGGEDAEPFCIQLKVDI